jgi:hypothetical protein
MNAMCPHLIMLKEIPSEMEPAGVSPRRYCPADIDDVNFTTGKGKLVANTTGQPVKITDVGCDYRSYGYSTASFKVPVPGDS